MSTLYIFGSGASKCAGLPTTDEFVTKMIHEREASTLLGEENEPRPGTVEIKFVYENVKKRIEEFVNCKNDKNVHIDEYVVWYKKKYDEEYDKELMRLVYWYFWDRTHHVEVSRFHKLFINSGLLKKKHDIISFNYDLLIEKAIYLKFGEDESSDCYPLEYNTCLGKKEIFKPMGSVNLVRFLDNDYLKHNINKIKAFFPYKYIEVVMKWFGTMTNEFKKEYFKKIKKAIDGSDRIISFGYSFPNTDEKELSILFSDCDKEVEMVCGKNFVAPWSNKIKYVNAHKTFEEWVLENAKS